MAPRQNPCAIVFDVGGSDISAAICRANDYRLGTVISAGHPELQSSDAFVDVLCSLATQAIAGTSGVLGASLAMPGPFDYALGVSRMHHKMPYLFGVDLRKALAERMGW